MISADKRYKDLKDLIAEITHLPENGFNTRQIPYPTLNSIIWVQMRNEGYTTKQIARSCGKNYSTIIQQSNRTKYVLKTRDRAWKYEITVWDILQERLKELRTEIPRSAQLEIIADKIQRLSSEELDEILRMLKKRKDAEEE